MVDLPAQENVDRFLPPYRTANRMDLDDPKTVCYAALDDYMEFNLKQELDMRKVPGVIEEVELEFKGIFGRSYGGLVEKYCCEDAEAF
jgi:pyruvate ferredoxin oxidoreductase alpha subunit